MKEIHLKAGERVMIIYDGEPTPTPTPSIPDYEDDPSLGGNVELRLYNKTDAVGIIGGVQQLDEAVIA